MGFFVWFSMSSLLPEIKDSLGLSNKDIWTSTILNDIAVIFMRSAIGPICDNYGARLPMSVTLIIGAIACSFTGLIHSSYGLSVLRFFIGIVGSTFVMSQYWTITMFSRQIIGTANAIVGGWGNAGGGVSQLVMGAILFPIFRNYVFDGDAEKAWRLIFIFPAVAALLTGIIVPLISDDAPRGYYKDMKKNGEMTSSSLATVFRNASTNRNTWLLSFQYACCFGIEITMNNAASLYFKEVFHQTTEGAAVLSSIFGWINIFARPLGGILSDKLNKSFGLRGRLWVLTLLLVLEGLSIVVFAQMKSLSSAITTMVIFSCFVQATEGAVYGIVPYVNSPGTGSVAGFVGSGGNLGAIIFGFAFRELSYKSGFIFMGTIAAASSILSVFIRIPMHGGLVSGEDEEAVINSRRIAEGYLIDALKAERQRQEEVYDNVNGNRRDA